MLILFWLTSKLFITHFKILEGYIMESELYCLLFYNQVQETQVEPMCLLKKKKNNRKAQPKTSGLQNLLFVLFSHILANVGMPEVNIY